MKAPAGRSFRPTSDRVKEALFSILAIRVPGATVLDLYAGSGALGIEALSRGAESCTFVEKNRSHLALARENLVKTGFLEQSRLMGLDARKALQLLSRQGFRADLVLMDPPYNMDRVIPAVLAQIENAGLLRSGGLIVVEHSTANRSWCEKHRVINQKKYGDTMLSLVSVDWRSVN